MRTSFLFALLIRFQWVKDIQEFDPSIPFVLVGTQVDLRNDKKKQAELSQKGKAPIPYEKVITLGTSQLMSIRVSKNRDKLELTAMLNVAP